jgi:lincosamide nucleotidyltransferase A/C/D/E
MIPIWIDGGWGIDALLEKQTRDHSDLDIVIEEENVNKSINLLKSKGFKEIPKDDSRPWNFVIGNNCYQIDYHVINFDKIGNGIYGPIDNGVYYPKYAFNSKGIILETEVDCISPKYQIESHQGYDIKYKDYLDVKAICVKYKISLPDEYIQFK